MVVYGGDEVNALVFDFGSSAARIGYAGEDCPRSIIPSYTARDHSVMSDEPNTLIGEHSLYKFRPHLEFKRIIKDTIVEDWDGLEALWNYSYKNVLRANSSEHPLMMTESTWNPKENRAKLVEMAFEKFDTPAFYLGKDAILSAFASGKSSALVLSSGADVTSVVPVYDGYKQNLAGEFLSEQGLIYLNQRKIDVVPQYQVKRKSPVEADKPASYIPNDTTGTHPSFHTYAMMRSMHDFKNTICHTPEVAYDPSSSASRPAKLYEFANGYNSLFKIERFSIPEIMFNPRFILRPEGKTLNIPTPVLGVQHLLHSSVQTCDPDIRALMYQNIIVSGGNTMFPGFAERLQFEMSYLAPGIRVKIHSAGSTHERLFSPWIGGSILASLGTFHQLWISKKEYEEYGASVVDRR